MDSSKKTVLNKLNKFLLKQFKIQFTDEEFLSSRLCKEFDVDRIIGSGGFGAVLAATNKNDKVPYAIKIIVNFKLKKDEIIALSKLHHPNVVKYNTSWDETYDKEFLSPESRETSTTLSSKSITKSSGEDSEDSAENSAYTSTDNSTTKSAENCTESSSTIIFADSNVKSVCDNKVNSIPAIKKVESLTISFIQQELCDKSLRDLIGESAFFDVKNHDTTWNILSQIFSGVAYIHSQNIIHKDLNPNNIFLKKDSSSYQIKIGDFGLAKFYDQDLSEAEKEKETTDSKFSHTKYLGTSYYIAPEVKTSKTYNQKCDSYSLGIIMFELFYPFSTQMERDNILSKLISENEDTFITYPDDFNIHVGEEDLYYIDLFINNMLQRKPENRLSVGLLSSSIVGYQTIRWFLKSSANISARFISMQEFFNAHKNEYGNEKNVVTSKERVFYETKLSNVLHELKEIFTFHGIKELPGNFHLSTFIENTKDQNISKNECFGYRIIEHANIDNAFAQLNENVTNSFTFAWVNGIEKCGVVDYVAPKDFANTVGAEILFLMTEIPKCIPLISKDDISLHIGHIGILKAICNYYKFPFQKLHKLLESETLNESSEKLVFNIKELLNEYKVNEQDRTQFLEIQMPEKNFNVFKNKLSFLRNTSCDQTVLTDALSEIQNVMEKFNLYYGEYHGDISYCVTQSYRSEFYTDGLSYASVYRYWKDKVPVAKAVCAGGRYDTYLNSKRQGQIQIPLCAYGINIFVENLVSIKDDFYKSTAAKTDILLYPDKWESRAFEILRELQKEELSCRIYYGKDVSDKILLEYCKANNFNALLKVIENGKLALCYISEINDEKIEEIFSDNKHFAKACRRKLKNL